MKIFQLLNISLHLWNDIEIHGHYTWQCLTISSNLFLGQGQQSFVFLLEYRPSNTWLNILLPLLSLVVAFMSVPFFLPLAYINLSVPFSQESYFLCCFWSQYISFSTYIPEGLCTYTSNRFPQHLSYTLPVFFLTSWLPETVSLHFHERHLVILSNHSTPFLCWYHGFNIFKFMSNCSEAISDDRR